MRQRAVSVELLSVGSELLKGEHIDDNSPYLSRELLKIGLRSRQFTLVPDFPFPFLVETIRNTHKRCDVLIVSGGLGPTDDDVTRQAVSKALRKKLIFSPHLAERIERTFRKRGLAMPKINERQAYLPQGAKAIPNPLGSAPGLLIEKGKKILVVLPGVPEELQVMFEKSVLPYLKHRFPRLGRPFSVMLRTIGVPESRVNELLEELVKKEKKIIFGFYAHPGIVDVTLTADSATAYSKKIVRKAVKEIRGRLSPFLFEEGTRTLEEAVFHLLEKRNKTVSVAESCTGGALSSDLTKIPGSSRHFKMGIVAYSNEAKSSLLKVPRRMIRREGAVSRSVAESLARQARIVGKTDFGLGVTGILGPGGGTKTKPVGLVYMALASPQEVTSRKYRFVGERETMRIRAVKAALDILRQELLK